MSDTSIVPGQAYASNPQGRFGTHAMSVAGVNPNTGGAVSIDPGQPVTTGAGGTTIFAAIAAGGATAGDKAAANVLGLAVGAGEAPGKAYIFAGPGPLTLPDSAWAAVAGGPLTPGARYYLSPTTEGTITTTEPVSSSEFATPIGFALDANTMWVQIGLPVGPLT